WILTQDRLLDEDTGAVLDALDRNLVCDDEARRAEARLALEAVTAIWELDERTRGSAFATCQTMIEPWLDPKVATASVGGAFDLATLRYASELLGTEEVPETTRQTDSNGRVVTASGVARLPLLPPDLLRRTKPGEALLIHGTLHPAHLRARPYYTQRSRR